MRTIKTSKGEFVVSQYSEFNWRDRFYIQERLKEERRVIYLSQQQAYDITGKKANPKDDLLRLLEAEGIEITNNTYIFKV